MDERHGASPEGGAPVPSAGSSATPTPGPWAAASPTSPTSSSSAAADPLAPYRPAEPTARFDPSAREFEESFDTGRIQQLPTGQLLLVHRPGDPLPTLLPEAVEDDVQRRVFSWIGAILGSIGALASLFVGWLLPLPLAGIIFGVLGLRREEHGRTLAFVAIGTGITGLVFSAVWLGYYAIVYGALPA
jgi:hypothetical protein